MNPIAECEAKINRVREDFFLGLTRRIGGFRVRPMRVRDYILLDRFNSPLLSKQLPSDLELAMFLWWLSPQFDQWAGMARGWRVTRIGRWIQAIEAHIHGWRVKRALGRAPNDRWEAAVREAFDYIADTFQDAPMGGGAKAEEQYMYFLEGWHERLKAEHGWFSRDEFLSMTMPEVFANLRAIILRNGGKIFNKATHDMTGDIITRLTIGTLTPKDIAEGRLN